MGESGASRESILGELTGEGSCFIKDRQNSIRLHSFCADKLKYVHNQPLGYNKCKFTSTLEADLMVKSLERRQEA